MPTVGVTINKNCYIHFQFISLHCTDYLSHSETLSFSQLLTERSGKVTGWQLKICNLATFKSHFCWLNSRVSSSERYWNFFNKELSHLHAQIRRSTDSSTPPILHAWFFGGGGCQGIPPTPNPPGFNLFSNNRVTESRIFKECIKSTTL